MIPQQLMRKVMASVTILITVVVLAAGCGSDPEPESATETETDAPADDAEADDGSADSSDDEAADDTDADDNTNVSGDAVTIRWFVGLGTGAQPEQIEAQDAVVTAFNESQSDIVLEVEYVDNEVAFDTLATQIAGGNSPDIIGPVGIKGSNTFAGRFLDLEPLIEASNFDLSVYDEAQVEFWREDDGSLTSIPFGVYPAFIYYNTELFDEAGLAYPPQEFDEPYADGDAWDMDKLAELAAILSVDANGNDATSASYDADDVVQFGFNHQWVDEPRAQATFFGPGSFVADDGSAVVPDHWVEEWSWYHNLIHDVGAAPTQAYLDSELLANGNTFSTGNVAMAHTHLWYTCCVVDDDGNGLDFFDVAVVPEYNGEQTSKLHADIFRIMDDTEHPEEAFEVLSYFLTEAADDLLSVYGAMPARSDLQADFLAGLDETFPQGVNWQVAIDSLSHPDTPSHEGNMPNFAEAEARIAELTQRINSEPDLDVDVAAEDLQTDLQTIFES